MKSTTARIAILLTATLIAASCSGDDDAPEVTAAAVTTVAPTTTAAPNTTSTTEATTTTTTEPVVEVVLRQPLTGEVISDASEIPDRPALAVKIDNHPRAKPQAGLNEADLVFEEVVEFGTRFAAVFHTQDSDPVGPVRSGRSQDVGILSSLDEPLFAWSGGNAGVRAVIRDSSLVNLDAGFTSGYYRRSGRGGAPHNLFTSTEAMWASTPEEFRTPPQQFPYLAPDVDLDDIDGEPATTVTMTMSGLNVRWDYDEESGQYLRSERGSAHPTELSGQVATDNLVVMAVRYQPSQADRRSPEAQVAGSGPVVVFSRGVARPGFWVRLSIDDPFTLVVEIPEDDDEDESVDDAADETAEAADGDTDDADVDADAAGSGATGIDPFQELEVDLVGLVPGRAWIALVQDAENFVAWE